jgi:hypothetical protein
MRIIMSVFILLGFLSPLQSKAQHNFGAGIVLGDPTGLTAKYNLSNQNAIDAALSFGGHNNFYVHATYLWLMPPVFNIKQYPVNWYFGLGARLADHDHNHNNDDHDNGTYLGVRGPLGLRMNFDNPRIELFGEVSFAMDVTPETDFDIDFGIGARYYF